MLRLNQICRLSLLTVAALATALPAMAAPSVQLTLPLTRTNYQTNEIIDLAAVRSDTQALPASDLVLNVTGKDGSKLSFTFPAAAVPIAGADARATELLHLNAWYLRPGHYTIDVAVNGATASKEIDIYTSVRKSDYKLVNWGTAKGADALAEGENGLGYNLFYGSDDPQASLMAAGVDYMNVCTMSGGHQMDLRPDADWSDPYVIAGGTARVAKRALQDRSKSNCVGVHFYDEPGLTWEKDPITGETTPHAVPSQHDAYIAATGKDVVHYTKVDPKDPASVADWTYWAKWKLGFMDAAWQDAKFGVNYVMPDYLTATQSQYGFTAFTDGYYFNVVRSLPVTSGHGGYDDYWMMYFNPSYYLESARARDVAKPNWYLPTWYGGTTADRMRMENNLVFATGIQGVITPPECDPKNPNALLSAPSIVAGNKLYQRLGPIFAGNEQTRPPVGMLYSISDTIRTQTTDTRNMTYSHAMPEGQTLPFVFLAGKMLQQPMMTITDEDIIDGTAAAYEKAIVLGTINYLDPKVITGLESFIQNGGKVYKVAGGAVDVPGAIDLPGTKPIMPDADKLKPLIDAKNYTEAAQYQTVFKQEVAAKLIADKLGPALKAAGIMPVFTTDQPGLSAYRHQRGEIEYLFAINTAPDPDNANRIKPITATLKIPADGRPVYDAVAGGPFVGFAKNGDSLVGQFRFGPGQMRVIARSARPIGGVRVGVPDLYRDYTVAQAPVHIDFTATLVDTAGGVISGGAPLEIQIVDPLGATRYTLNRATNEGVARISVPLALNDPAGAWKIVVKELLGGTQGLATFNYTAITNPGAIAGETERAAVFGNDRYNIFRFFRLHKDVTIVRGASEFDQAAADRLANILKPWDVRCTLVNAADVAHSRVLTPTEASTWIGLDFAGMGQIKPGGGNAPSIAGFAVSGPVVLIGSPDDNDLIKFMQVQGVLPYIPAKDSFPGRGRGYLAWQYGMVGRTQESITAIAYDAAGMDQAIGSMYEALAGIDPLTPFVQPSGASIQVATTDPNKVASLAANWDALLPDYAVGIAAEGEGLAVTTFDGSVSTVSAAGVVTRTTPGNAAAPAQKFAPVVPPALAKAVRADRKLKFVATGAAGSTAVGYWGGLLQLFAADGTLQAQTQLQQDVTSLAWSGAKIVVGQSDGHLTSLGPILAGG